MFAGALRKIFGSVNDRTVKKKLKFVEKINALEDSISVLSDADLCARTEWLKGRLANGETLDDIVVDAFATVREASKRVLGMRHFDVQMVGGLILHEGRITEMRTGEGKTLVATLPLYLNALSGKGAHLITVNDYLASRDAEWMGRIFQFLGLSVGCIVHGLSDGQRRQAYAADITYGTNHEFGFDYLRDNMKFRLEDMVQRPFNYVIVDEVDSILIDEARTPLIISGSAEDSSELYAQVDEVMTHVTPDLYEKDEKQRNVMLKDEGVERIEELLRQRNMLKGDSLYDIQNLSLVHHVNQSLRAHALYTRDVDYIVKDNKVIIIDEFTGRMMDGRRYSEGLHQALEAKEHAHIEMENQTLASITYQNFFRLYPKLAGMTGTGMTEAPEFDEIYKLSVVEVPTNLPIRRIDHDDEVYLTAKEKYNAVIKTILECKERQQPILVGTTSIEKSELISGILKEHKIQHQVLNARYHDKEAMIIADAGALGAVTIATNMAGRGTDIKLGGNLDIRIENALKGVTDESERKRIIDDLKAKHVIEEEAVRKAGGLFIIGTERHESRRIDNQLRGRSGRQGDPGASRFYISLQDDLMRIFGSERLDAMLRKLGVEEGEAISHSWISKALERAQQKVEARNFDIRKHLLRYDDVMNDQRKVIYEQRRDLMQMDDIQETMKEIRHEMVERLVRRHIPEHSLVEHWNLDALTAECHSLLALDLPLHKWAKEEGIAEVELTNRIQNELEAHMQAKESKYGAEMLRAAERTLLLRLLDQVWKEHLLALDHLRQGIGLRAYAQSNPLIEYKREAFALFQEMLMNLRENVTQVLAHFEAQVSDPRMLQEMLDPDIDFGDFSEETPDWGDEGENDETPPPSAFAPQPVMLRRAAEHIDPKDPSTWGRVPRNSPCPCESGKKYKQCHGALES